VTIADDVQSDSIDAAMGNWRQGDCVLEGEHAFVFWSADKQVAEETGASEGAAAIEVAGFVVITQSCDVVRAFGDRPYVTVSPLVRIEDEKERELIRGGYQPNFVWVPGVAGQMLVADLDRQMTVSKAVVAKWKRVEGCTSEPERRSFTRAVARKYSRFAFPDNFRPVVSKLRDRLRQKHDKASAEGDAIAKVTEIRVSAAPIWDATEIELTFWFVCHEPGAAAAVRKSNFVEKWMELLRLSAPYTKEPIPMVVALEDMTAADYLYSDPLDLDHLSGP
jgi:hypothetical protein